MKRALVRLAAGFALASSLGAMGAAWEPPTAFRFEEFLFAPVRVHLLQATNAPAITTTLSETDVTRILGKVNRVWAQAGIQFHLHSLVVEQAANQPSGAEPGPRADQNFLPSLRPKDSHAPGMFHLYYLHQLSVNGIYYPEGIFVKDTASLRAVDGGIDEPIPRVTSHELGHALDLPHRQKGTNLLASGTTGVWLNAGEIATARAAARKLKWIESAPAMRRRRDDLRRAHRVREAQALDARLKSARAAAQRSDAP